MLDEQQQLPPLVCNEEIESSASSSSSPGPCSQDDRHPDSHLGHHHLPIHHFFTSKLHPDPHEDLHNLALKEAVHSPPPSYSSRLTSHQLVSGARSNAVHWMIKVGSVYGFSAATVALSVSYLDRYLSRELEHRDWKAWMIELVSVACLSVAAKMEEAHVPLLQDLQIQGLEHLFESVTIQRMEVTVMRLLDWRMSPLTSLTFVAGFLQTLELQHQVKIAVWNRINELVLGSLTATSVTVCALEEIVPLQAQALRRSLLKTLPLEEAQVDDCYSKLEELVVDPVRPILSSSQVLDCLKSSESGDSEPLSRLNRKRNAAHHAAKKVKY